ncbi:MULTISPECIES: response regulator transcription factor [unclassified Sphingomonas]|jgi:DNA-binding CsgD family transcriptional regulator|nr:MULTISPECIES: response regulator transcription factor [unclassified Sphingomonas]
MWKRIVLYGALLAAGTLLLQWLDYQRLVHSHVGDVFTFLIAGGFLALGVWLGAKVIARPAPRAFDGNPQAVATLGLSPREMQVLEELLAGRSNQEIAERLGVSRNTVKTHVARLLDKLGAKRRGDAVARARELGIVR